MNRDSDGDGLLDGEEISIETYAGDERTYCYVLSNPCSCDSDSDGLDDFAEFEIGTDLLSSNNSLPYSDFELNPTDGPDVFMQLRPNTWLEWQDLINSGEGWNYIHNQVQKHIVNKYEPIEKELPLKTGRADLYHVVTYELWEVKPASHLYKPEKLQAAKNQLERYVNCDPNCYKYGGTLNKIGIGLFTTANGKYEVYYQEWDNGLIFYTFYPIEAKQEKENAFADAYEKVESWASAFDRVEQPAESWGFNSDLLIEETGTVTIFGTLLIIISCCGVLLFI